MSEPTSKAIAVYLGVAMTLAAIVAVAAWFVAGALGVEGTARLVVAGQTPVFLLLAVWALAILFPVEPRA